MSERVAVVGSRSWWPPWKVSNLVVSLDPGTIIVSGGAPGADTMAWNAAVNHCKHLPEPEIYYPDWKRFGMRAGLIRNTQIVKACDWMVAFWDGKVEKSGTLDSVRKATEYGKCVLIIWNRKE